MQKYFVPQQSPHMEAFGGKCMKTESVERRYHLYPHASYKWGISQPVVVVGRSACLFGDEGQLVTQRTLHQTALARYIPFPLSPLARPTWPQSPSVPL